MLCSNLLIHIFLKVFSFMRSCRIDLGFRLRAMNVFSANTPFPVFLTVDPDAPSWSPGHLELPRGLPMAPDDTCWFSQKIDFIVSPLPCGPVLLSPLPAAVRHVQLATGGTRRAPSLVEDGREKPS